MAAETRLLARGRGVSIEALLESPDAQEFEHILRRREAAVLAMGE